MRKITWLLIGVMVIAVALITYVVWGWVEEIPLAAAENATLTASINQPNGVDISTSFCMIFSEKVSSASVSRYLKVEPEIELGVHQGKSPSEVLVVPAAPLQAGIIYTFTLATPEKDLSWAFQTAKPVAISSFAPAPNSISINPVTPITITLNQMLPIDLEKVAQYIRIEPRVEGSFHLTGRSLRFMPTFGFQEGTVYRVTVDALPVHDGELVLAENYNFAFETGSKDGALPPSSWDIDAPIAYRDSQQLVFRANFAANPQIKDAQNGGSALTQVKVKLWAFDDAQAYAACLLDVEQRYPEWSYGFAHLCGLPTDTLKAVWSGEIPLLPGTDGDWQFRLPAQAKGCYLLSASYENVTRDVLFQVSNLSVFSAAGGSRMVLWMHDLDQDQPVSAAQVQLFSTQDVYAADSNGAILLNRSATSEAYIISNAAETLVLMDKRLPDVPQKNSTNLWRYLYLDQDIYHNGDTIHFWGLAQPVDGSALDYNRVSVFIYAAGDRDPLCRIYAPLVEHIFSGELLLPYLQDGAYRLVISQSGNELIGADFAVGSSPIVPKIQTEQVFSGPQISMGQSMLKLGDAYQMAFDLNDADEYLFIRDENGIVGYAAENQSIHSGVFEPKNGRNYQLWGVAYKDKQYLITPPCNLLLDDADRHLELTVSGNLPKNSGKTEEITITAAPGAAVAVTLLHTDIQPQKDIFTSIYGDLLAGNLTFAEASHGGGQLFYPQGTAAADKLLLTGKTDFFAALTADDTGKVQVALTPEQPGQYYLVVQAIAGVEHILAGSQVISLQIGGFPSPEPMEDNCHYAQQRGTAAEFCDVLAESKSGLLLIDEPARLDMLSELVSLTSEMPTESNASAFFAAEAAKTQLACLADEVAPGFFTPRISNGDKYQQQNGGIAKTEQGMADLAFSVKVASLNTNNVDRNLLKKYFVSFLTKPSSSLEQSMAISGLAALQIEVLPEISMLLKNPDLQITEYLYLLWGYCLAGGSQNAKYEYQNGLFADFGANHKGAKIMDNVEQFSDDNIWLLAVLAANWGNIAQSNILYAQIAEQDWRETHFVERFVFAEAVLAAGTKEQNNYEQDMKDFSISNNSPTENFMLFYTANDKNYNLNNKKDVQFEFIFIKKAINSSVV